MYGVGTVISLAPGKLWYLNMIWRVVRGGPYLGQWMHRTRISAAGTAIQLSTGGVQASVAVATRSLHAPDARPLPTQIVSAACCLVIVIGYFVLRASCTVHGAVSTWDNLSGRPTLTPITGRGKRSVSRLWTFATSPNTFLNLYINGTKCAATYSRCPCRTWTRTLSLHTPPSPVTRWPHVVFVTYI